MLIKNTYGIIKDNWEVKIIDSRQLTAAIVSVVSAKLQFILSNIFNIYHRDFKKYISLFFITKVYVLLITL